MRYLKIILIVFVGLQMTACIYHKNRFQQQSMQASMKHALGLTHHRGLAGEKEPHNGWAKYSQLVIDNGQSQLLSFHQNDKDLLIEVYDKETKQTITSAYSILGVGLFFKGASTPDCSGTEFMMMGLYAERQLMMLSKLLPNGPRSFTELIDQEITLLPTEFGFMSLSASLNTKATMILSAQQLEDESLQFTIKNSKAQKSTRVRWQSSKINNSLLDAPIKEWRSCWNNLLVMAKAESPQYLTALQNAQTFGELKAITEQRNK